MSPDRLRHTTDPIEFFTTYYGLRVPRWEEPAGDIHDQIIKWFSAFWRLNGCNTTLNFAGGRGADFHSELVVRPSSDQEPFVLRADFEDDGYHVLAGSSRRYSFRQHNERYRVLTLPKGSIGKFVPILDAQKFHLTEAYGDFPSIPTSVDITDEFWAGSIGYQDGVRSAGDIVPQFQNLLGMGEGEQVMQALAGLY